MNKKANCWEYMKCGREPGGRYAHELGVCPVTTHEESSGINGGDKAGRYCWAITGSLCKGEIQGHFARKLRNCLGCVFFQEVEQDEGRAFVILHD